MPAVLSLIRHGQAEVPHDCCVGQFDIPLARVGKTAVEKLVGTWGGPAPVRIVCSDLARAVDSAAILGDRFSIEPEVDMRLREIGYGEWEGLPWDDIRARFPDAFERWGRDWAQTAPPGGESLLDLERRVAGWLEDLATAGMDAGGPVVVVAHAGSIRVLLAQLLEWGQEQMFKFDIPCASISQVAFENDRVRLLE